MSTRVTVELSELRKDAKLYDRRWGDFERQLKNLTKRFRDVRNNERLLKSRNKREGWYVGWHADNSLHEDALMRHVRCCAKEWALRYRKQTGAQVLIVKGRRK